MKFEMGAATLGTLARQSQAAGDDLGALITQLVAAAQPLEGSFEGAGKQAFLAFKLSADDIAAELNGALAAIVGGQVGMDTAFTTGDSQMADNAVSGQGSANFDAARFSGGRA
jgi:hypothetical protein